MKYRVSLVLIAVCAAAFLLLGETSDERNARRLAKRIVPEYARKIDFRQTDDTSDVFCIHSEGKRLVIEGNNAISMATGLNHYLKNYCGVTVPWYAFEPVQYPSEMPAVDAHVRVPSKMGRTGEI